jgi:REP element-mobilizing transposase RayT
VAHSRTVILIHCVFSAKARAEIIPVNHQEKLFAYIQGIATNLHVNCLAAGGTANHIHLLLSVPPTMTVAEAVQKIKANSSRWISEHGCDFA